MDANDSSDIYDSSGIDGSSGSIGVSGVDGVSDINDVSDVCDVSDVSAASVSRGMSIRLYMKRWLLYTLLRPRSFPGVLQAPHAVLQRQVQHAAFTGLEPEELAPRRDLAAHIQ